MNGYSSKLQQIKESGNLRVLPQAEPMPNGYIVQDGQTMLNLSSNDYLGLAGRTDLRNSFLDELRESDMPLTSSSSRLLTGNFPIYNLFEKEMAERFDRPAALLFNSGYHANIGILPALADSGTLILADRLVHASIIDGIRLSACQFLRFRHNDYDHLERLLHDKVSSYSRIIIVTESLFSMDGDVADLNRLVAIKKSYPDVLLYVDEAHAIGVRGQSGLGIAEEQCCVANIDLLVGTFGKALASMGAYVVCSNTVKEYLVNTMRPLIFSTALPPSQVAWTRFLFLRMESFKAEREHLARISNKLAQSLPEGRTIENPSHIIPYTVEESEACVRFAAALQRHGFYCLPVRPPTVPQGTARIRFSLTSQIKEKEINSLTEIINNMQSNENI